MQIGLTCRGEERVAEASSGLGVWEVGAMRLGGDGAALTGRRADCACDEIRIADAGIVRGQGVGADGASPRPRRVGTRRGAETPRTEPREQRGVRRVRLRVRGRGGSAV